MDSPAMITLRRATTQRVKPQTSLTFFPEPVFDQHPDGILSAFVAGVKRSVMGVPKAMTHKSRTTNKENVDYSAKTFATIAPAVKTEIAFVDDVGTSGQVDLSERVRRCSSKYISDDTTLEVIWDESDSSSQSNSTLGSSAGNERQRARKKSSAVECLEMAFARCNNPVESASAMSTLSVRRSSQSTAIPSKVRQHGSVLVRKLSHLSTRLSRLPRREQSQPSLTVRNFATEARHCPVEGSVCEAQSGEVEVFPPCSRSSTRYSQDSESSTFADIPMEAYAINTVDVTPLLNSERSRRWTLPRNPFHL